MRSTVFFGLIVLLFASVPFSLLSLNTDQTTTTYQVSNKSIILHLQQREKERQERQANRMEPVYREGYKFGESRYEKDIIEEQQYPVAKTTNEIVTHNDRFIAACDANMWKKAKWESTREQHFQEDMWTIEETVEGDLIINDSTMEDEGTTIESTVDDTWMDPFWDGKTVTVQKKRERHYVDVTPHLNQPLLPKTRDHERAVLSGHVDPQRPTDQEKDLVLLRRHLKGVINGSDGDAVKLVFTWLDCITRFCLSEPISFLDRLFGESIEAKAAQLSERLTRTTWCYNMKPQLMAGISLISTSCLPTRAEQVPGVVASTIDNMLYRHDPNVEFYDRLQTAFKVAFQLLAHVKSKVGQSFDIPESLHYGKVVRQHKETGLISIQLPGVDEYGTPRDLKIHMGVHYAVLNWSGQNVLVPTEFVKGLYDILSQRALTMYELTQFRDLNNQYPTSNLTQKIYSLLDRQLSLRGNEGYQVVKLFEPMMNGIAITVSDIQHNNTRNWENEFLTEVTAEFTSIADTSVILDYRDNILPALRRLRVVQLFEIAGLFRHWGHPFIEVEEGLRKLQTNAKLPKQVSGKVMNEMAVDMLHIILKAHKKMTGKLPRCQRSTVPRRILPYIRKDAVPPFSLMKEYAAEVLNIRWSEPTLKKPAPIPLNPLLSDKAHGPTLSELQKDVMDAYNGRRRTATPHKVLRTTMEYEQIDPIKFLTVIDRTPEGLSDEDLVILLKAKERELKTEGRFFSLMTYKLRLYFTATEMLMSKHILPLFPEVTVNYDSSELLKILSKTSEDQARRINKINFSLHLDFEKWNAHQRYESTAPVFKVIDKALGFDNLITRTHEFFERCVIGYGDYLDKWDTDLEKNTLYHWKGHRGGIEGLRQKGWSICGALLLRKVARDNHVQFKVLLQGDNQVVSISWPTTHWRGTPAYLRQWTECRAQAENIKRAIEHSAGEIGLIVKAQETWITSDLIYYGKNLVEYGRLFGIYLKKLSKVTVVSSDLHPTLSNALSTVFTTVLGALPTNISVGKWLPKGYIYAAKVVREYLQYDPVLRGAGVDILAEKKTDSDRFVLEAISRESSIGGMSGFCPLHAYCRDYVDPVSESITSAWKTYKNCEAFEKYVGEVEDWREAAKTVKDIMRTQMDPLIKTAEAKPWSVLLEKPEALNLEVGSKNASVTASFVEDHLFQRVDEINYVPLKNGLLNAGTEKDAFAKAMAESSIVCPRFWSDTASTTPGYTAMMTVKKITRSNTITSEAIGADEAVYFQLMLLNEEGQYLDLIKMSNNKEATVCDCPTARTDELRLRSWGKDIYGATVPHPAAQCCLEVVDKRHGPPIARKYEQMYAIVSDKLLDRDYQGLGNFKPFIGSATKEKRVAVYGGESTSTNYGVKTALRLRRLIGWIIRPESELAKAINKWIFNLTGFNEEDFPPQWTVLSGNPWHRLTSNFMSRGCWLSCAPIVGTYVNFSSSTLCELGRGQDDNYVVMFQAIMCYYTALFGDMAEWGLGDRRKAWSISFNNTCCLKSCNTEILDTQIIPEIEPQPLSYSATAKTIPSSTELMVAGIDDLTICDIQASVTVYPSNPGRIVPVTDEFPIEVTKLVKRKARTLNGALVGMYAFSNLYGDIGKVEPSVYNFNVVYSRKTEKQFASGIIASWIIGQHADPFGWSRRLKQLSPNGKWSELHQAFLRDLRTRTLGYNESFQSGIMSTYFDDLSLQSTFFKRRMSLKDCLVQACSRVNEEDIKSALFLLTTGTSGSSNDVRKLLDNMVDGEMAPGTHLPFRDWGITCDFAAPTVLGAIQRTRYSMITARARENPTWIDWKNTAVVNGATLFMERSTDPPRKMDLLTYNSRSYSKTDVVCLGTDLKSLTKIALKAVKKSKRDKMFSVSGSEGIKLTNPGTTQYIEFRSPLSYLAYSQRSPEWNVMPNVINTVAADAQELWIFDGPNFTGTAIIGVNTDWRFHLAISGDDLAWDANVFGSDFDYKRVLDYHSAKLAVANMAGNPRPSVAIFTDMCSQEDIEFALSSFLGTGVRAMILSADNFLHLTEQCLSELLKGWSVSMVETESGRYYTGWVCLTLRKECDDILNLEPKEIRLGVMSAHVRGKSLEALENTKSLLSKRASRAVRPEVMMPPWVPESLEKCNSLWEVVSELHNYAVSDWEEQQQDRIEELYAGWIEEPSKYHASTLSLEDAACKLAGWILLGVLAEMHEVTSRKNFTILFSRQMIPAVRVFTFKRKTSPFVWSYTTRTMLDYSTVASITTQAELIKLASTIATACLLCWPPQPSDRIVAMSSFDSMLDKHYLHIPDTPRANRYGKRMRFTH